MRRLVVLSVRSVSRRLAAVGLLGIEAGVRTVGGPWGGGAWIGRRAGAGRCAGVGGKVAAGGIESAAREEESIAPW